MLTTWIRYPPPPNFTRTDCPQKSPSHTLLPPPMSTEPSGGDTAPRDQPENGRCDGSKVERTRPALFLLEDQKNMCLAALPWISVRNGRRQVNSSGRLDLLSSLKRKLIVFVLRNLEFLSLCSSSDKIEGRTAKNVYYHHYIAYIFYIIYIYIYVFTHR